VWTSRMRGTLSNSTGSSVSKAAAIIGKAAFLFPAGRTWPRSLRPPSTMNTLIGGQHRPGPAMPSIGRRRAPAGREGGYSA
jgi:hypothetical protein